MAQRELLHLVCVQKINKTTNLRGILLICIASSFFQVRLIDKTNKSRGLDFVGLSLGIIAMFRIFPFGMRSESAGSFRPKNFSGLGSSQTVLP